jgi:hypothetical protein
MRRWHFQKKFFNFYLFEFEDFKCHFYRSVPLWWWTLNGWSHLRLTVGHLGPNKVVDKRLMDFSMVTTTIKMPVLQHLLDILIQVLTCLLKFLRQKFVGTNPLKNSSLLKGVNSIARKKKTERVVPPINNSSYLNQTNGIYANHVTPSNAMSPSNGGITNQAYARDARYVRTQMKYF